MMGTLKRHACARGLVTTVRALFDDAQLQHRGHFQWLDHPEIGPYATDRSEMTFSLTPGSLDTPAPLLGQHHANVRNDLVGLTKDENGSLAKEGAVE